MRDRASARVQPTASPGGAAPLPALPRTGDELQTYQWDRRYTGYRA